MVLPGRSELERDPSGLPGAKPREGRIYLFVRIMYAKKFRPDVGADTERVIQGVNID